MGRKKTQFQHLADGVEGTTRVANERPDRGANRRQQRELSRLANRLAGLDATQLRRLPLDEDLKDEVAMLARSGKDTGRKRQVRRVVSLLRDVDLDELHQALDGRGEVDHRLHLLERWRTRILQEGDAALQDFLECHEGADRNELRTLARQGRAESPAGERARKKLFQVLKAARPVASEE